MMKRLRAQPRFSSRRPLMSRTDQPISQRKASHTSVCVSPKGEPMRGEAPAAFGFNRDRALTLRRVPGKSLAAELDISESTVDEMVRRGVLPKPIRLSTGCVRWSWIAVEAALASIAGSAQDGASDPFLAGVRRAAQAAIEGRREPS
jgi:predicted DNA-binding transcriptional regulator AlpA